MKSSENLVCDSQISTCKFYWFTPKKISPSVCCKEIKMLQIYDVKIVRRDGGHATSLFLTVLTPIKETKLTLKFWSPNMLLRILWRIRGYFYYIFLTSVWPTKSSYIKFYAKTSCKKWEKNHRIRKYWLIHTHVSCVLIYYTER